MHYLKGQKSFVLKNKTFSFKFIQAYESNYILHSDYRHQQLYNNKKYMLKKIRACKIAVHADYIEKEKRSVKIQLCRHK